MTVMMLVALVATGETVTLYNDNGNGGIHQTTANVVVDEGQYFVDLPVPTYNGRTQTEHLKVYRVTDSARLLYNQARWAEPYVYVVERSNGFYSTTPYYFNMQSEWIPSLTEDPNDPYRVVPVKKLLGYHDDYQGRRTAIKVVLVQTQGNYMLYYGDDFFGQHRAQRPPSRLRPWLVEKFPLPRHHLGPHRIFQHRLAFRRFYGPPSCVHRKNIIRIRNFVVGLAQSNPRHFENKKTNGNEILSELRNAAHK